MWEGQRGEGRRDSQPWSCSLQMWRWWWVTSVPYCFRTFLGYPKGFSNPTCLQLMPWLVIVILHAPQSQNLSTCFLAPAKLPDVMRIHSFFCSHSVYLSAQCQDLLHPVHRSFPLDNVDPILPCFWDFLHPQNLLIKYQIVLKYFQKHLSDS